VVAVTGTDSVSNNIDALLEGASSVMSASGKDAKLLEAISKRDRSSWKSWALMIANFAIILGLIYAILQRRKQAEA
ncbi:MAG: hypothetical protein MI725_06085, partial [Pirellulales bacterium]|nr:hypothetical protein [Pirellulales bacterium]